MNDQVHDPGVATGIASGHFWHCISCGEVLAVDGHAETAASDLLGPLWRAAVQDERAAFLAMHRSHPIELLTPTTPMAAVNGSPWDSRTTWCWESAYRSHHVGVEGVPTQGMLDEPWRQGCRRGQPRVVRGQVGVPTDELARTIDEALFPHTLTLARLQRLTDVASQPLSALDPAQLEILYESPVDPSLGLARLPADALERVITSLGPFLQPWERDRVAARLRAAHAADELLLTVTLSHEVDPDPA